LNDLLAGILEKNNFTRTKTKTNFLQGTNPEMTYITGGKTTLTLFLMQMIFL